MKHLYKGLARHFMRIDLAGFFRCQRISVWWKSDGGNEKLSAAFRSFVAALIEGEVDEAEKLRRSFAAACVHWIFCCRSFVCRKFMLLAYAEYAYYCDAVGKRMMEPQKVSAALGVPLRKFGAFADGVAKRLRGSKLAGEAYSAFLAFTNAAEAYCGLPVKNCAVCATMGAGKSTFINALLGCDVLPARCEATTAKVTSVYDKDGQRGMVGFFQTEKGKTDGYCDDVSLQVLDAWNCDKRIAHLFLRGDLDGIGNNGMAVAVHDTPGTNNSGDRSHRDVTFDFLSHNQMDLILFVLNAESLGTTDENALLREVYRDVVKRYGTDVFFILNKVDSLDAGKESLDKMIRDTARQLEGIGYARPVILPVASKAARLLKMKARGLEARMTSKERRELSALLQDASCTAAQLLDATGLPCVERRIEDFFKPKGTVR